MILAGRHAEVAHALLAGGHAYHCYCSPAEIDAARDTAKAEGRPQLFLSPWRDRDAKDAPAGIKPTIRLKAPREGETAVDDKVQGHVVFQNKEFDDLIILRSDGSPTYNLAVVVDDHDMGVTHVIRGVDHLTNAGRPILDHGRLLECGTLPELLSNVPRELRLSISHSSPTLVERLHGLAQVQPSSNGELHVTLSLNGHAEMANGAAMHLDEQLRQVMDVLRGCGAELRSIESEEHNLERLFLKLTGNRLRD